MSTRPTVLVLGANGRFGVAATRAFAEAGWRVLAQVRRAPASLPPGAEALPVPLDDTAALADAAAGTSVVVHAANPAYTRWPQELLPMARRAMDVAQRLGALFMLPGNVYVYGSAMPPVLRTGTPFAADTRKGRLRVALEAEMAARAPEGLASVVIRAGDFIGGGPGTWLDIAIAKSIARGRLAYPGPVDRVHAWAYLPDLAQAFVRVAERAERRGFRTLHFPGYALTGAQMLDAVQAAGERLGVQPPAGRWQRDRFPWWMLRAGALVVPLWREVLEMAYLWECPHALDGRDLEALTGPLPATPLVDALAASLHELRLVPERALEAAV